MEIGIEARWITFEKTGFGNYALNLLKGLSRMDFENEYLIYLNDDYENEQIFSRANFQKKVIKRRPEIYKHISIPLDIILKKRKFDFYHFLYNAPSLIVPCPFILTVHDVSYKYIPDMITKTHLISLKTQLLLNARKAIKIITISESSKKDIIKHYKVSEEKIEVIYEGVNDSYRPIRDEQKKNEIKEKYGLPDKYLLYVGTYLPHKNLETLLHAYQKLKLNLKIPHSLVLVGKKGRNYKNISSLVTKLNINENVLMTGFIPEEDLPYVYGLSELFIFPSLYEGFGLPLLEAMACGTPVISSNTSCLPEIGGDAAVYFSPKNAEELSEKIKTVISNQNQRNSLIEKGLRRVKYFSWNKMAEKTLNLYADIKRAL